MDLLPGFCHILKCDARFAVWVVCRVASQCSVSSLLCSGLSRRQFHLNAPQGRKAYMYMTDYTVEKCKLPLIYVHNVGIRQELAASLSRHDKVNIPENSTL